MMLNTTELNSLILVWMTLMLAQGHNQGLIGLSICTPVRVCKVHTQAHMCAGMMIYFVFPIKLQGSSNTNVELQKVMYPVPCTLC